MRILYVGAKYDYGDPNRGLSFEHYNFYHALTRMGHEVQYFDFMAEYQKLGKEAMNRYLWETVRSERPTVLFCCLFEEEIDMETVSRISNSTNTTTFNWFCDDHWRFESFSKRYAPAFNYVSTTSSLAMSKYLKAGHTNVIKTQWACNHFLYRPDGGAPRYDATFIGQPHGDREVYIRALRRAGVDVRVWGHGWESGRLSQEEMIEVFGQSRINLNFTEASTRGPLPRWRRLLPRRPARQIKGRNFEVPGCGGFLLTEPADNLAEYYVPGVEVVSFEGIGDGVRKAIKYLADEPARAGIARAGLERTLREHTYEHRFNAIFQHMGLGDVSRPLRAARQEQ